MELIKKPKLLYITIRADFGGGPFHVNQLIENLIDNYEIYCASPLEHPYGLKWISLLNPNHFFKLEHRSFSIRKLFALSSFIKRNQIGIIHSHGKGAGIYSRMVKILNPKLVVIHTFHGFHPYNKKFSERFYMFFERLFGKLTDQFINVSYGEQNLCLKYKIVSKQNSCVIYNGIMQLDFYEFDKNTFREKLYIDKDKFVVVSINRFDPHKNITQILKIAEKLKDYPSIHFILVGDGEDRDSLEAEAKRLQLPNVSFVGFKENPQNYIFASDTYISTSKGEALGYSLIEAQMIGVPVIASDVVGHNEIISDKINGYLFQIDDTNSAVSIILNIYNDSALVKKIIEEGKINFKQRFTLDIMLNSLNNLYKKF